MLDEVLRSQEESISWDIWVKEPLQSIDSLNTRDVDAVPLHGKL